MKKIAVLAVLAVVLVLAGCAGVGNEKLRSESETTVAQKIVEGKTTKAEIQKMFGSPGKASFTDNGLEIWNYEFTKVSADAVSYIPLVNMFGSSASGKKNQLVVMFDQANI